jgi:dTMP kinase
VSAISREADENRQAGPSGPAESSASTVHRVRSVLAIRGFRRLWGVTYLLSLADWLSLMALTGLVTKLTSSYFAQSFGFSAVVLTQLAPGLVFAPLGGLLADRFDRRTVMVVVDLIRCALFLSIALVGTLWWLLAANFLIGCSSMMWIPAKDSAVPNLLRRKDQVETATQLGLVMTYGISVVSAAALYSFVTGLGTNLHLYQSDSLGVARIIVIINGSIYLIAALVVAFRIPELAGRAHVAARRGKRDKATEKASGEPDKPSMFTGLVQFLRTTPLIRGLLLGMIGAFAAGGAVIGTAHPYAKSVGGGESTFGALFVAVFVGLATGMATSPRLARRMSHNRLFGVAIVVAGLGLVLVALSPHVWISLAAAAIVGAGAGVAFLTGITIIGSQVEDSIRGRVNALYQALMKVVLFASVPLASLLVVLVGKRGIVLFGAPMQVDGTRPVLLGAGLLAVLAGFLAYKQMGDRSTEPIMADLLSALRRRPRRPVRGLLISVEGNTREDTASQAHLLVDWLATGPRTAHLAGDPAVDESRLLTALTNGNITGVRAHALVAAAVRADVVERTVLPALAAGDLVVMERYVDSPIAQVGAAGQLEPAELEGLADWATGWLRPDLTVLLDRDPASLHDGAGLTTTTTTTGGGINSVQHHWRVQRLLTEMAAADPDRYVVVDAEGTPEDVAARIRTAVAPMLIARGVHPPGPTTEPGPKPGSESQALVENG